MSAKDATDLPRSPRIRTLAYDEQALDLIAEVLAADVSRASFRLPSSTVWQMTVPGAQGRPAVMLTLWTGIRRLDVVSASATVVFTDIQTVDLVPDVEVQFRRTNRECLIVARGGKIIVRA
jgi:hypothetical protein